jgi:hypothetical protein
MGAGFNAAAAKRRFNANGAGTQKPGGMDPHKIHTLQTGVSMPALIRKRVHPKSPLTGSRGSFRDSAGQES